MGRQALCAHQAERDTWHHDVHDPPPQEERPPDAAGQRRRQL
eukprot:CAMPEP_0119415468 /NCGR_PEP_ID=MMETSP1335-20130426/9184_1 /TAXON_ID=259385 /ORGANISM="Chrysoculter rhomboideus, Strain RCC1486" /LENGTH=41 /DNA_ID= /DNA_START= /DNA_END= /DNA_ORIENTATION=